MLANSVRIGRKWAGECATRAARCFLRSWARESELQPVSITAFRGRFPSLQTSKVRDAAVKWRPYMLIDTKHNKRPPATYRATTSCRKLRRHEPVSFCQAKTGGARASRRRLFRKRGNHIGSKPTTVAAMDLRLRTALQEFAWSGLKTRFASTSASLYFAGFFLASCKAASAASLGSVGSASAARPTK